MQASILTHNQARALGSSDIRLTVAMALDLSTLSTLEKFEFSLYNEELALSTGLALKTVQNCMTQAKKLVHQHHAKFSELVMNYALSEAALTRGMQHVYALLQAGGYGRSLPELAACLAGKQSPMLKAQAARAEAAAIANKALMEAANKVAPEPVADVTPEPVADVTPEPVADVTPEPVAVPESGTVTPDPFVGEGNAVEIDGPTYKLIVWDNATYQDLMALAGEVMALAAERQATVPELMAA